MRPFSSLACIVSVSLSALIGARVAECQEPMFVLGDPVELTSINHPSQGDFSPSLSPDGLELYFMGYQRPGGFGSSDLWVAKRGNASESFEAPVNLGPTINKSGSDSNPDISGDGLTLFFDSDRGSGGFGDRDLWMTSRTSLLGPWQPPVNLGETVNSTGWEGRPSVSGDGLILIFDRSHDRLANSLWMSTRESAADAFSPPVNLGFPVPNVNAGISQDGLSLFFSVVGEYGGADIGVATRASLDAAFGEPINLGPHVNTELYEVDPDLSADGTSLFFVRSDGPGVTDFLAHADIWEVPIRQIPEPFLGDVNGDGEVNGLDVDPFVEVLLSGPYQPEADMNEDQVVNGLDVDPFVAAVVGGTQSVPEPSALLLAFLALGVIGALRKWGV